MALADFYDYQLWVMRIAAGWGRSAVQEIGTDGRLFTHRCVGALVILYPPKICIIISHRYFPSYPKRTSHGDYLATVIGSVVD